MADLAGTSASQNARARSFTNPFMASFSGTTHPLKVAFNYLAVCIVVVAVVWVSLAAAGISLNFDFIDQYRVRIWDGFCMTVGIFDLELDPWGLGGSRAKRTLLALTVSVRSVCQDHSRNAAHRTGLFFLLHHRYCMGR